MKRLALAVALVVVGTACTSAPTAREGAANTIVVGVSGAFAENQIVAEMYAQVLEDAGYTVRRQLELRSREFSQSALESGEIDVKPEYLSSLLLFVDPNAEASNDPEEVLAQLRVELGAKGIEVLQPSLAQDKNQFVANAETARRYGLTTMSSLARVADQLTLGAPPECPQRPFCLAGLRDRYGILFRDFTPLDVGGPQTVQALKDDDVQVALLFSTDPSIGENGFVPLFDDRYLQDAENITPVVRSDRLDPQVRSALDAVSASLTSGEVTNLIRKVVIEGQDVAAVATAFLTEHDLL